MSDHDHHDEGVSRRKVLECMTWAGTGVLWTISGGVPRSMGLVGSAQAAEPAGMTFLQISDSHMSVSTSQPSPMRKGTLEEAIATRCKATAGEAVIHGSHRRHHTSVKTVERI